MGTRNCRIPRRYHSTETNGLDKHEIKRKKEASLHPKYQEMRRKRDHILSSFTPKVRISVINNTKTANTAKEKHGLSVTTTRLLGRAMAAASLLTTQLDGDERIELRYTAEGPLKSITVEAIRTGEVRGYVSDPSFYMSPSAPIGFALRAGSFSVLKLCYGQKAPHQSIVPIAYGDVSSEIMNMYKYSDQIPAYADFETIVDYQGNVTFSGGLIIEALPPLEGDKSNANYVDPYVQNLKVLPPLSVLFGENTHSLRQVLDKIAPGEIIDANVTKILTDFYCRCSKSKFVNSLAAIDPIQLKDYVTNITEEQRNLKCQFCSKVHRLEDDDLDALKKSTNKT